ncbi:MAG: response regulator [Leptolyngbyaceae cyanobacterium SM2_5_2]|nr:response regulator [Leptolyngbyaceae cyanobacterium SM2_5_2]
MPSFPITVLRVACSLAEDDRFGLWLADQERYQYAACRLDQIASLVVPKVARVILLEAEVGLEGLADIKARWPDAALVILIEPQHEPEMPTWLAQGANDYLLKPHLSPLRLSHTVQQLAAQAEVQTLAATLPETQQALQEAVQRQGRLLTLLRLSSEHISLMDPQGRVLWHNRQPQAVPEPTPGVSNGPLTLADCYPPDTVKTLQTEGIPTALREGLWMGENWLFDSEQNIIPVSQLIIAHRSASGEVEYLSSVMRDISDLKAAEKALQTINHELERQVESRTVESERARKAAEAANQAKSLFLVNMGHELRTPLNAILGFSQMIAAEPSLTPRQIEEVSIINRSGEHLLTLINEIIDLSKLEVGRTPFNPAPFNLHYLLDGLVDRLQCKAEAKGLSFILHQDPALPTSLVADEAKLRQVLLNLVSHAIKLTQAGGIKLRVALRQNQLLCEVEDTGSGIDPADLDQLFEPFSQIGQSQVTREGTGLGLPICQQLVRLMGGELWVNSKPGVGSIFAFSLPVGFVSDEPLPSSTGYRRVVGLAPGQKTHRMLVVEDNWTNRSLLQNLLEPLGFQLQLAANGQDAVAIWANWHPHLVWMDLRMP